MHASSSNHGSMSLWLAAIVAKAVLVGAGATSVLAQQLVPPEATVPKPDADEVHRLTSRVIELFAAERYAKAEPLAKRVIEISERTFGRDHRDTLMAVTNLARIRQAMGRYDDAEPLYRRVAESAERTLGPDHPDTLTFLNNVAEILRAQGRYAESEPLHRRVLAASEKALGPEDPATLISVNNLAEVLQNQGRYAEAELLYRRALEVRERALGPDDVTTLNSVNNLAGLYQDEGRYTEAEPLLRRAVSDSERVNGRESESTLLAVENLGRLYKNQGRLAEAEPLYLRAFNVGERTLGPAHPYTLTFGNNLATLYLDQERYVEAELLLRRVVQQIEVTFGPGHEYTFGALNNLASVYSAQRRNSEAERLLRRAMHAMERLLGLEHPSTLMAVYNLALVYQDEGRYGDAERLHRRVLESRLRVLGPRHPDTVTAAAAVAGLLLHQRPLAGRALEPARLLLDGLRQRRSLGAAALQSLTQRVHERSLAASRFTMFATAAWAVASTDSAQYSALFPEVFAALQDAVSGAADRAVAEQAARRIVRERGSDLAELIRERNRLEAEWVRLEGEVAFSFGSPPDGGSESRAAIRARLADVEARIEAIDARLRVQAPEYFALIQPTPLDVATAQRLLAPDEAIILVVPAQYGTHVVALTADHTLWRTSRWGAERIRTAVARLRRDAGAQVQVTDEEETRLWDEMPAGGRARFDRSTANSLYEQLITPVLPELAGKQRIYIAAGGGLAGLPFSLLVSAPPAGADDDPAALRETRWFADDFALVHIFSLQSLALLKQASRAGSESVGFLGVGDPVLRGNATARNRGSQRRLANMRQPASATRGDGAPIADVSRLRRLRRLPGTARELEAVRRALNAPPESILSGATATEPNVRNRDVSQDRIILFSTHALTADQDVGAGEAGLVLTPPAAARDGDDGFLAASEVATLRLNADWVILSACNTATGDSPDNAGLGQLGRAFFYAGARNLLASHWPVSDDVAPILITRTLELERAGTPRAEAFRQAMREIRMDATHDTDTETWAHPFYWAPFVLIGDGGS